MDLKNIFKTDYLDIVFEGKNKSYGGYELRKKYNRRMTLAALIAIFAIGGLFAASMIDFTKEVEEEEILIDIDKTVTMKEPPPLKPDAPPPPPPPSAPPPVKPTVKFTPPVIAPNKEVTKEEKMEQPPKDDKTVAGPQKQEGSLDAGAVDPSLNQPSGPGKEGPAVEQPKEVEPPKKKEPLRNIAQRAKYNGDINSFLRSNLNYPQVAIAEGIEGVVVVEFVVDEHGNVKNAKVVKGLGGGCNNEALRVVKKTSGKWNPGVHNGEKYPSYFTLPITFKLQ